VSRTQKNHGHTFDQRIQITVGKGQISIAQQIGVSVGDGFPALAFAVGKCNVCVWVMHQNSQQFTTRVACRAYNSYVYHFERKFCKYIL
jgi:hypothetical protein